MATSTPSYMRAFPEGLDRDAALDKLVEFEARRLDSNGGGLLNFNADTRRAIENDGRVIDRIALYLLRLFYTYHGLDAGVPASKATLDELVADLVSRYGKNTIVYTRDAALRARGDAPLRRHFFLRSITFTTAPVYDPIALFTAPVARDEGGSAVYGEAPRMQALADAVGMPVQSPHVKLQDTSYMLVPLKALVDERRARGVRGDIFIPLWNGQPHVLSVDEVAFIDAEYDVQVRGKKRKPPAKKKK